MIRSPRTESQPFDFDQIVGHLNRRPSDSKGFGAANYTIARAHRSFRRSRANRAEGRALQYMGIPHLIGRP